MDSSQRRADAQRRAELAAASAQAEALAAQRVIDEFVRTARAVGLRTEPLQATLLDGRRVKTPLVGWYLNASRTLAITPEGSYYQLVMPGSVLARFTGVTPAAAQPVLEVGRGGRDGETGPLSDFLARTLETYRS